jgi:uncharacterized protein
MKKIISVSIIILSFSLLSTVYLSAQTHYEGQHSDKMLVKSSVTPKVYVFNLQDVKLLDSPFKENQEREKKWLLSINNNRLLHVYRVNAGMATHAKALGGWEVLDGDVRGHTLGHFLSGLALMYASTGDVTFLHVKADKPPLHHVGRR